MHKPAFHVTETVLVWHEISVTLSAIGIERKNVFRRYGRCVFPYLSVLLIRKCMLDVELKLIHLSTSEHIDQVVERFHSWHFAAADIMHHAARRVIGPIVNYQLRQGRPLSLQKLPQRLNALEDASQVTPGDDDSFTRYAQPIALSAGDRGIQGQFHLP